MKTRTLLLLSVGTALAILLAGGVLLLQLSSRSATSDAVALGEPVRVGDVTVTVVGITPDARDATLLGVEVEIGGVDDPDGLDSMRLITGDRSLAPLVAPDAGRCTTITVDVQQCRVDFDVSGSATTSRVLVMRRGDERANWRLPVE